MKKLCLLIMMLSLNIWCQEASVDVGTSPQDMIAKFSQSFPFGKIEKLISELQLTTEQATKVQQIALESKKLVIQGLADALNIWVDLEFQLKQDKPDRKAINKKIDEGSKVLTQLAKQLVNKWLDVWELLTPEQREKIKQLKPSVIK